MTRSEQFYFIEMSPIGCEKVIYQIKKKCPARPAPPRAAPLQSSHSTQSLSSQSKRSLTLPYLWRPVSPFLDLAFPPRESRRWGSLRLAVRLAVYRAPLSQSSQGKRSLRESSPESRSTPGSHPLRSAAPFEPSRGCRMGGPPSSSR